MMFLNRLLARFWLLYWEWRFTRQLDGTQLAHYIDIRLKMNRTEADAILAELREDYERGRGYDA